MAPDLASLRLLADVARLGGIAAAGRAHGITQQSASERVRSLEADVGLDLVTRGRSGSALTPTGRLVVEWSADLLARADDLDEALSTLRRDRSRELRVHASLTVAETVLPRVLVRARRDSVAHVTLHATNSASVVDAVRSGAADLGFVEGPVPLDGLGHRGVGVDELVLVAAPDDPWARRRRVVVPDDLGARALSSREEGSGTRRVWEDALAEAGVAAPPPEAVFDTTTALLASVAAGGPPAFVSRRSAIHLVGAGELTALPTVGLALRRPLTAVWQGGSLPARGPARDLLALVAAALRTPEAQGEPVT
ncbi:LysR family transcriptional regulator [Arthrobacter sp. NEB 688]|uniref:LysR family transcriptional regulator n=1 Tax=Arthrobacter sp. NEB 688 TaxID=904039 RepID=UPI001566774D|nr:LysR family transcriptional regulator [Arthrobacter sp. NEB 688]QKE83423.1 LysR family transcriptional regulator [Arthrobacter sp. NEB 688]